jgi:hypothetical protein
MEDRKRRGQLPRTRELHDLLYKEPTKIKVEGINLTYEGLIPKTASCAVAQSDRAANGASLNRLDRWLFRRSAGTSPQPATSPVG